MKHYETPEVNVKIFVTEDVVTTSGGYSQGGFEGWAPDSDDSEFGG